MVCIFGFLKIEEIVKRVKYMGDKRQPSLSFEYTGYQLQTYNNSSRRKRK